MNGESKGLDHDDSGSSGHGSEASGREAHLSQSDGRETGGSADRPPAAGQAAEGGAGKAGPSHASVKRRLYNDCKDWQREVAAEERPDRSPASRDWARVIHSACFRRLQGKTQVFPIHESDFFRNRLTHSLEVSQIAEGIAQRLNFVTPELRDNQINERVCMVAGLIHDLGHPPFGHNGERALDDQMRQYGGFEGNAQTIRIITKLEKKETKQPPLINDSPDFDDRAGLNLTYRSILSALKYDEMIPDIRSENDRFVKGYYRTEQDVIARAKNYVDCEWFLKREFKTIECSIMDIADDIAYSTYDLEDILKAGFLTPARILATDESVFDRVAKKANRTLKKRDVEIDGHVAQEIFLELFRPLMSNVDESKTPSLVEFAKVYAASRELSVSGYARTAFSTGLVGDAIKSVQIKYRDQEPWLSEAYLTEEAAIRVEVLKHFTFESTIYTARVKTGEHRGYDVVAEIFEALSKPEGSVLMPEDLRDLHRKAEHNATARMRAIADFIAGMTDRYALEFHARLYSNNPQSIFKEI